MVTGGHYSHKTFIESTTYALIETS